MSPGTIIIIVQVKKNLIGASCKACGHQYVLDMRHKLTTFIVKNPPEKEIDSQVRNFDVYGKCRG